MAGAWPERRPHRSAADVGLSLHDTRARLFQQLTTRIVRANAHFARWKMPVVSTDGRAPRARGPRRVSSVERDQYGTLDRGYPASAEVALSDRDADPDPGARSTADAGSTTRLRSAGAGCSRSLCQRLPTTRLTFVCHDHDGHAASVA